MNIHSIPKELKERDQWVLWKAQTRGDNSGKIPYTPDDQPAKTSDPDTWSSFENVVNAYEHGNYDGIGFMFSDNDPFIGIDLDDCRNQETGEISPLACDIINQFATYCEVSPSGTGVKIFGHGENPLASGKNWKVLEDPIGGKTLGVELYDRGRYFTVTGDLIPDSATTIKDVQSAVDWLCDRFESGHRDRQEPTHALVPQDPVVGQSEDDRDMKRVTAYMNAVPGAISGQSGHNATFRAACILVRGFDLTADDAFPFLAAWNQRCEPPWTEQELWHKLRDADKLDGPRGKLWDEGRGTPQSTETAVQAHPQRLEKPLVILPGPDTEIAESGEQLGELLAATGKYFRRGKSITKLTTSEDGEPILETVKKEALPAIFESVARLQKARKKGGEFLHEQATCSKADAELIMSSDPFLDPLPPIKLLTRTPILVERSGELVQIVGYDVGSGILASGRMVPKLSLTEAKSHLLELLQDFQFATQSDKSRALAAIITPALLQSGLLRGRAPLDLGEADKSQAGKGFRNKITAAIYNEKLQTVTQRRSGVGGLEESLSSCLIAGAAMVSLDNIRGRLDSPALESLLTEDTYLARRPYSGNVTITTRKLVVMMTSNKAELTLDLANRVSCVRIRKQPEGYQFKSYDEGTILDHVRANQPRFLGAVFAIIEEWFRQGMPLTNETRHGFRDWGQTLDWIIQNLLEQAPLLGGHQEAAERSTNSNVSWLRDVVLALEAAGATDRWLQTYEILRIIVASPQVDTSRIVPVDGICDKSDQKDALKRLGKKLKQCFAQDSIELEGFIFTRRKTRDDRSRIRKQYRLTRVGGNVEGPKVPQGPTNPRVPTRQTNIST